MAADKGQAASGYEIYTPWQTVKIFKLNTLFCFLAAFSAATDGYQVGINASVIANQGFINQFATRTNSEGEPFLDSSILSAWGTILSVGQIIGMTLLPFPSHRYGRKVAMYTFWLILAISVTLESVAREWRVWLVAKLLAGVGVGCLQSTLPTYTSETAPIRIRGGLLMCYSLWWTIGTSMAHVALNSLSKSHPTTWLLPVYTQWAQIVLMLIIYIFLPESPAWCVDRGHHDRAKKALLQLNRGIKGYDVDQQLQILVLAVQHEKEVAVMQKREHWYAIFRGTDGLRTLIALWTNLAQQFIGLTLFATYGTYFFQQAGMEDPFEIKVITSYINIATVIVVVLLADRIGRRYLSCGGTTFSWLSCIVIGILGVSTRIRATDYLFVLFACLWNVGMSSQAAVGWGFIGEISSQRLRPYTAGFGAAATCVAGVVMNQLVPYMVNANQWNWGFKTGWFYGGVGLPFTIGCWLLIPETNGRSAAELDELFERKIKPWRFSKTMTATQSLIQAQKAEEEK